MKELITYKWLTENGFRTLERLERQPYDHMRRCLGAELIGERFMISREDLCIDIAPSRLPIPDFWYVWITKASCQNYHPSIWIHSRHMVFADELILLYEALTGRRFAKPAYQTSEMGQPLFEHPARA